MALVDLVRALERDAHEQAVACVEEARVRAAKLREDSDREVSVRRRSVLGAAEEHLRAAAERRVAEARRRARRAVLEARQRFVDRVFAAAAAKLRDASAVDSYGAALPAHLEEVLAYVGSRPAAIVCPPALEESVRSLLVDRPHLRVRSDPDAEPGVVAVSNDGTLTVDGTLTARLQRMQPVVAADLVRRIDAQV